MEVRIVHLGTSGPWFSIELKAACLVGYEQMQAKNLRYPDLAGRISWDFRDELAKKGRAAPSLEIIRRWHREDPDYPHRMLQTGFLRPENLPAWAKPHPPTVQHGAAELGQGQRAGSGGGWWFLLFGLFGLVALALSQNAPPQQQHRPRPVSLLDLYRGQAFLQPGPSQAPQPTAMSLRRLGRTPY